MARKKNWYPKKLAKRRIWIVDFKSSYSSNAAALGLDGDIGDNNNDCDWMIWGIDISITAENRFHEIVALKDNIFTGDSSLDVVTVPFTPIPHPASTIKQGAEDRIKARVQRVKDAAKYTTTIGQAMDIIGAEDIINPDEVTGKIKSISIFENKVIVSYFKGILEGAALYCKIGNGSYELLGHYSRAKIEDTRVNLIATPEERTYKVINLKEDKEIGHFSPEWKITVNIH